MSQKQKVKKSQTPRKSLDEKISDIIGSEPSPTLEIDLDDIPTPKSASKEDKTRLSQIPPLASSLTFEDDEEIVVKKSKRVFQTPTKKRESKKLTTPSTSKQKTPAKLKERPTPSKAKTSLKKTPLKTKTPQKQIEKKKVEKKKVEKKKQEKKPEEKKAEEKKTEEKKSEVSEKVVEKEAEKKTTEKPKEKVVKKKEKEEGKEKKKKKQKTTNIRQGFLAHRTKLDGSIAEAIDLMNGVEHVLPKATIHKMISQAINELELTRRPRVSFSALATLHESIEHEAVELIYTAQLLSKFMNPKSGSLTYKALVLAEMYRKKGLHFNTPKEELDKLMKEAGFDPVIDMVEAPPVKEKPKKRKKNDASDSEPRKKAKKDSSE